ncbi:IS1595 family transposase, partial [Patescibacteria group bacterium]|nr:IS1595 family transposase [Patescibacteria group bacterium]
QPVFGIFERGGTVYTEIIPDCKRKTLRPIILGKIDPQSIVATDKWRGYDGLVDVGYDKHVRVNHSKAFVNGKTKVHINGIESFWSFTKRRLCKI